MASRRKSRTCKCLRSRGSFVSDAHGSRSIWTTVLVASDCVLRCVGLVPSVEVRGPSGDRGCAVMIYKEKMLMSVH